MPPLNAIRAFEVAARHLNLSRAAEELGVTQGAISKQVIALEDFIGAKLFERLPSGLSLTKEGRSLRDLLTPAFDNLELAFQRFSRRPPRSNIVRLATVASFASQSIVPLLDNFEDALPHIELEILTSDRVVDLAREEIDFSVRYGSGDWAGLVTQKLVPGRLAPVCAPRLLARFDGGDLASLVANTRRIQVFSQNEWDNWAKAEGVDTASAPRPFIMEHFLVALKAALAGQGLALLPEVFTPQFVAEGRLVRFSAAPIEWHETFYVAHVAGADRKPHVREVIDWLHDNVGQVA